MRASNFRNHRNENGKHLNKIEIKLNVAQIYNESLKFMFIGVFLENWFANYSRLDYANLWNGKIDGHFKLSEYMVWFSTQ